MNLFLTANGFPVDSPSLCKHHYWNVEFTLNVMLKKLYSKMRIFYAIPFCKQIFKDAWKENIFIISSNFKLLFTRKNKNTILLQ